MKPFYFEDFAGLDNPNFIPNQPALPTGGTQSTSRTPHDQRIANRQTQITKLTGRDFKEQEEWAKTQLASIGGCTDGLNWSRVPGGYRCEGGGHMVTDELLAEGKGRFYFNDPLTRFAIMGGSRHSREGRFHAANPEWVGPTTHEDYAETRLRMIIQQSRLPWPRYR